MNPCGRCAQLPCVCPWQGLLREAVQSYLDLQVAGKIAPAHIVGTPDRVVRAFAEYVSGYSEDPKDPLSTSFEDASGYDEMVHVKHIPIISMCAHHLLPIIGTAHFAYVPKGRVVGLSKIPRFIGILARRLQIQEDLTQEIVDVFDENISPRGCAVSISAIHCCMIARGVRERDEKTETTALRGCFKKDPQTRTEFLSAVRHRELL